MSGIMEGQEGMSGMSSMEGQKGMAGMSGMEGQKGMAGMLGMQGQKGMSGMSGMQGQKGMSGMSGMSGNKAKKAHKAKQQGMMDVRHVGYGSWQEEAFAAPEGCLLPASLAGSGMSREVTAVIPRKIRVHAALLLSLLVVGIAAVLGASSRSNPVRAPTTSAPASALHFAGDQQGHRCHLPRMSRRGLSLVV